MMAVAVQCVLLSVFLLSSVQTGAGQCDADGVSTEVLNVLLQEMKRMKADINTLTELYSNMSQVVGDLEETVSHINDSITELNETVSDVNKTVVNLEETVEEHKSQTSSEIADFQSHIDNPPTNDETGDAVLLRLLPYLNNMEDDLFDKIDESAISLAADFHNDLSSLNGSVTDIRVKVCDLNETVGDLEETMEQHKSQTTSRLADLQSTIDNPPTTDEIATAVLQSFLPYLNDMEDGLSEKINESANRMIEEHEEIKSQLEEYRNCTNTTVDRPQDHMMQKPNVSTCGGEGGWRRVVYLDMTDPTTSCPSGWQNISSPKRTCGRASSGSLTCDPAFFPITGGSYTRVCGKIIGYQQGGTDAFEAYDAGTVTTIDDAYVSGVSLTHGSPREHIWTFAAGIGEGYPTAPHSCPCDATISIAIPPFVGVDYFCESGVTSGSFSGFHSDDPLWDGQGCASTSTCCSFNNPPCFIKQLSSPTTDDIEARICLTDHGEDSPIELIELYVK